MLFCIDILGGSEHLAASSRGLCDDCFKIVETGPKLYRNPKTGGLGVAYEVTPRGVAGSHVEIEDINTGERTRLTSKQASNLKSVAHL